MKQKEIIFRVYHLVSWGVSAVIAALPFIGNHYGPAGMWWSVHSNYLLFGICSLKLQCNNLKFFQMTAKS